MNSTSYKTDQSFSRKKREKLDIVERVRGGRERGLLQIPNLQSHVVGFSMQNRERKVQCPLGRVGGPAGLKHKKGLDGLPVNLIV